jgi:hypothetical protein
MCVCVCMCISVCMYYLVSLAGLDLRLSVTVTVTRNCKRIWKMSQAITCPRLLCVMFRCFLVSLHFQIPSFFCPGLK